MPEMWVCQSSQLPGYVWTSLSDATDFLPGWKCEKLEKPLPQSRLQQWITQWKILRLIEHFPFE